MNYIFIILENLSPIVFTSVELPDYFLFKENNFLRVPNWIGGHYNFNTYYIGGDLYLEGIESDFTPNDELMIQTLKQIHYFKIFGRSADYLSYHIEIKNVQEKVDILYEFCQMFGEDYLYKCEATNEYCFVFELPEEIKLPIDTAGTAVTNTKTRES
jgi:hypothetical protein